MHDNEEDLAKLVSLQLLGDTDELTVCDNGLDTHDSDEDIVLLAFFPGLQSSLRPSVEALCHTSSDVTSQTWN